VSERTRKAGYLVGPALLAGILLSGAGLLAVADAADLPPESGPDVVILRELENTYEAVPFEHRLHAKMAQMWDGCVTCHHRSPQTTAAAPGTATAGSEPATVSEQEARENQKAEDSDTPVVSPPAVSSVAGAKVVTGAGVTQDEAAQVPACKSCHPVATTDADIHMPSLKGAYHRQCLNCHQEWMHENACVICHKPKEGRPPEKPEPAPDDIIGRMHPPIPEPKTRLYQTRFTPADGGNVLFRHEEHTVAFGIRCVDCHRRDNCADCHGPTGETIAHKPLRPGMTWSESHGPCMGCHQQSRCRHCHYRDDHAPPPVFNHMTTGQGLDEEHAKLGCPQCHPALNLTVEPTCGDEACHKDQKIDYPTQRPGPIVTILSPTPAAPSAPAGTRME
jgi:hypothetical protein